jgi:hypothetical protein
MQKVRVNACQRYIDSLDLFPPAWVTSQRLHKV